MIIDSHAHYANHAYDQNFRYLTREEGIFTLAEGNRETLFQAMEESGIHSFVEPGVSLDSCRDVLDLARAHPGRVFPAVGVHPTRSVHEAWARRKALLPLSMEPEVIAIGEIGLDYHYKREDQHRFVQHLWFLYQLDLAWRRQKPVILHVRNAHEDALRILRLHPARKLGGVVHCFYASREIAQAYLDLGYHIGIGGSLLQTEDRAGDLLAAVPHIPLERILLETDAPYILPYCKDVIKPKLLRRARNTSLILPAVAEKIAQLHGVSPAEVERVTAENAIRLFRLPIQRDDI